MSGRICNNGRCQHCEKDHPTGRACCTTGCECGKFVAGSLTSANC